MPMQPRCWNGPTPPADSVATLVGSTADPGNNQNAAGGENMAVDQEPVVNSENSEHADISAEVVETNLGAVGALLEDASANLVVDEAGAKPPVAVGPSIKSIIVGGPVLIPKSKSPLQPRALLKVSTFINKSIYASIFSWLSLLDIDPNTIIPPFINDPSLLVYLAFLLPPQINVAPLEKEALKMLQEEDDDLMEISGTNFTPRKRRHVKVREQLDDSFLRSSKRIYGKQAGFKDVMSAQEAAAEPQPLAIIPAPGSTPAPHLTKAVVHGIAEGFLQIHRSVASAALLDQDVNDDQSQ